MLHAAMPPKANIIVDKMVARSVMDGGGGMGSFKESREGQEAGRETI